MTFIEKKRLQRENKRKKKKEQTVKKHKGTRYCCHFKNAWFHWAHLNAVQEKETTRSKPLDVDLGDAKYQVD